MKHLQGELMKRMKKKKVQMQNPSDEELKRAGAGTKESKEMASSHELSESDLQSVMKKKKLRKKLMKYL